MRLSAALSLLLYASTVVSQPTTLLGTVLDAEGGRPLIGATAAVGGTGVVSDASGQFRLALPRLPATVIVRFLGFTPQSVTIGTGEIGVDGFVRRTFRLDPTAIELDDVTVTDENVAVRIMRQVLARKSALMDEMQSYSSEVYTRFTMRGRGRYVQFTEELSDTFWRAEGGSREIVLARRRRPDGRAFRYAAPQAIPDFYFDDDVVLDGFQFPSPTHPDALSIYHFRIGDITEVDGLRLIDIAVRPQRSGATGLSGRIQIVDSLFVISEAELRPAGGVRKPAPVQDYTATYRSIFTPMADSVWLPKRFYVSGRVDVGAPGARLPQVTFNQASILAVRRINAPVADSLWFSGERRRDADGVYGGREVFLSYRDQLPLSEEEAEAELILGPIPLRALLPPEGLLRNYVPIPVEEPPSEEEQARAQASVASRLLRAPRFWYNRVDRRHIGLQPTFDLGERLVVAPELGFSPDTSLFTAGIDTSVRLGSRLTVEVSARHGTATRFDSPVYNRLLNTVPTALGWPDYFDYMQEDRVEATGWLGVTPSVRVGVGGVLAEQSSVVATSNYEGAITGDGQRDNPLINDGQLRAAAFSLEVGERTSRLGAPQGLFATASFERGNLDPVDGSTALSYSRLSGSVDLRVPTFFRRRPNPHTLTARALGGLTWGDVPLQRFGSLDGSSGPFAGFGTLRAVNLPYEGSRWGGIIWSYDAGRTLFESLGLGIPTGLALHGGHAWTSNDTGRTFGFDLQTNPSGHHELGLSLMRPSNFPVRLDFTRRLDDSGWFFTFGLAY